MTRRRLVAGRVLLRCMCGLAVLTLPTAACRGEAPGSSPQTTSGQARGTAFDPKTYALDEAKVRKMGAVMSAWDPKGPEPTGEDPTVYVDRMKWIRKGIEFENKVVTELLSHNSTATLESVPELKAAMAREGLTPREFAAMYLAYKTAEGEELVAGLEQLAGAVAGTSASDPQPEPRPPGVFNDNIELIRRMDKEGTLPEMW